jgi:hypothetical protein
MPDLRTFLLGAAVTFGLMAGPAMAGQTLDLAQVKRAADAYFAKLDKDGDGTVDAVELRGVITPAALKAADPDNDGTLSKREYLALAEKLFRAADANHDGTVTAAELATQAGQRLLRVIGD